MTLKRERAGRLASIEQDEKTPYGDGIDTCNGDKDTQSAPIEHDLYSVRTSRYGRLTTFSPE